MTPTEQALILSAKNIAEYCRNHVCTDCPLNIGDRNDTIIKAHCVCDYNIIHLPSTWKVEELNPEDNRLTKDQLMNNWGNGYTKSRG